MAKAQAAKAQVAKFRSRYPNLTLYMEQVRRRFDAEGRVVDTIPSRRIRFVNGAYDTADAEEITFLRGHRFYGNRIMEITPGVDSDSVPKPPHVDMRRGANPDEPTDDDGDAGGQFILACDYPGCEYVATDADESNARRKLNAHKSRMGHHTEA